MYYAIVYKPMRQDFLATMTGEEQRLVGEHFHYLEGLLEEGKLLIAGRCEDATFGLALLQVESRAEAEKLMKGDPVSDKDIFVIELKEWRLALSKPARS